MSETRSTFPRHRIPPFGSRCSTRLGEPRLEGIPWRAGWVRFRVRFREPWDALPWVGPWEGEPKLGKVRNERLRTSAAGPFGGVGVKFLHPKPQFRKSDNNYPLILKDPKDLLRFCVSDVIVLRVSIPVGRHDPQFCLSRHLARSSAPWQANYGFIISVLNQPEAKGSEKAQVHLPALRGQVACPHPSGRSFRSVSEVW